MLAKLSNNARTDLYPTDRHLADDEVETALTNETLYAKEFQHLENSFQEYSKSVRIATTKIESRHV